MTRAWICWVTQTLQKLPVNSLCMRYVINGITGFLKPDISGRISRNRFMHIARGIDDNLFSRIISMDCRLILTRDR